MIILDPNGKPIHRTVVFDVETPGLSPLFSGLLRHDLETLYRELYGQWMMRGRWLRYGLNSPAHLTIQPRAKSRFEAKRSAKGKQTSTHTATNDWNRQGGCPRLNDAA